MKSIVNGFVFIYFLLKKFFFNNILADKIGSKKSIQKAEEKQGWIKDEYQAEYSSVTRWQTI